MEPALIIRNDSGRLDRNKVEREIQLIDCHWTRIHPGLVIEEELTITRDGVTVSFAFGDQIMVAVKPNIVPHVALASMIGEPLSRLVDMPNLAGHPLHSAVILDYEIEWWGVDLVVSCPDPWRKPDQPGITIEIDFANCRS